MLCQRWALIGSQWLQSQNHWLHCQFSRWLRILNPRKIHLVILTLESVQKVPNDSETIDSHSGVNFNWLYPPLCDAKYCSIVSWRTIFESHVDSFGKQDHENIFKSFRKVNTETWLRFDNRQISIRFPPPISEYVQLQLQHKCVLFIDCCPLGTSRYFVRN